MILSKVKSKRFISYILIKPDCKLLAPSFTNLLAVPIAPYLYNKSKIVDFQREFFSRSKPVAISNTSGERL